MSAKLQTEPQSGGSGIKLFQKTAPPDQTVIERENDTHYVFWAGDLPIPTADNRIGRTRIDPMVITSFDNYGHWDRDQNDIQTGARRHPHASRKDEVWTIKTAGSIVEWLERNWGAKG